ncbi:MAG: DNA double-strand break repair nuclease NurA [Methanobacteriota archaeon]|nr:MAG: DNA double-strand break repair nuclease NurA [Euryarchaeota archaeon]
MLDLTYRVLAEKKPKVRQRIDELLDHDSLKVFEERWRTRTFAPRRTRVGGGDGSINHRRYRNLVIYAVNATAFVYDGGLSRCDAADIGILHPYYQVEERLHLYRAIYELKTALTVLDQVDLFLIDGSLLSDLKALKRLEMGLSKEAKQEVLELLPEIEGSSGPGIASARLMGRLSREEGFREKAGFLEYIEYLSCLEKLITAGIDKVVGISKSSTRSRLGGDLPDIAVYGEVTRRAGYSQPETEVVARRFPVYDELFRSLVFTVTNFRLEEGKEVYMLEIPREADEEEVTGILETIRSVSVGGYPYLLEKAHKEVVIKNSDMERIITGLGVIERTGREVLE